MKEQNHQRLLRLKTEQEAMKNKKKNAIRTKNYIQYFPGGSACKESACNVGDLGSIPWLGRSPAEGKGCLLQYSGLENSMDCIVPGVAKNQT